jgi:RNA polymerase sigma-70 factor (ECF subfamily)
VEPFETYRNYLFAIAYRMLGSAMDAEDAVQETYLRYQATPPETLHSPRAYLATIVTRLCLDQLERARRTREVYIGPWLPEPILTGETPGAADPEQRIETQETISLAFLVLMEQLQPFERAVFLLREVFDYEFTEIAAMLGKSEAATRRSFSRAKAHLRAQRPRFSASPQSHQRTLRAFQQAVQTGDLSTLMSLLAENVTLWTDGGGQVRGAFRYPVQGREVVARSALGSRRFWPEDYRAGIEEVNGEAALVVRTRDSVFALLTIEEDQEQVQTIRIILNPEKLARL